MIQKPMNRRTAHWGRVARVFFAVRIVLLVTVIAGHGEALAQDFGYHKSPISAGATGLVICLPPLLTESQLAEIEDRLSLGQAQRAFIRTSFGEYVAQCEKVVAENKDALIFLSVQAGEAFKRGYYPSTIDVYSGFLKHREEVATLLVELEENLLGRVIACLNQTQLEVWPRVHDWRRRLRCRPHSVEIHAARIDLSQLVLACGLRQDSLEVLQATLQEYEARITPLFVAQDKERSSREIRVSEAIAKVMYYDDDSLVDRSTIAGAARAELYSVRYREALATGARLQRSIAESNQSYLKRMLDLLDPGEADALRNSYRRLAMYKIYTDTVLHRFDELFSVLHGIANGSPELSHQFESIRSQHLHACEMAGEKMEDAYLQWCYDWVEMNAANDYPTYSRAMWEGRRARWDSAEQALKTIQREWPASLLSKAERAIEFANNELNKARAVNDDMDWPGNGP